LSGKELIETNVLLRCHRAYIHMDVMFVVSARPTCRSKWLTNKPIWTGLDSHSFQSSPFPILVLQAFISHQCRRTLSYTTCSSRKTYRISLQFWAGYFWFHCRSSGQLVSFRTLHVEKLKSANKLNTFKKHSKRYIVIMTGSSYKFL